MQLLGTETGLRRLLSSMLFGGWGAAAIYNAGGVQLHFGRGAQETVLKSCEWKGVPAKAFVCLGAKQCPYSPCFVAATAATAGLQRKSFSFSTPISFCPSPDLCIIHRPWTGGNCDHGIGAASTLPC